MQKKVSKLFSAPSIRLKTLVVLEVVILLTVSLGGLFYFTRKALVEEAKNDAEQRLEGVVQHVDNVLLSIEQSAGNFYYEMIEHLDQPERMETYCRRLVECNSNIFGCVIAFKPNYYPERERFLIFVQRKRYNSPELIVSDKAANVPYTTQKWYSETMETCRPAWIDPGQNHVNTMEPIVTFCLPIRDHSNECVGVIAVGLSINLLSQIVLETKPSPNSYSVLLSHDGTYIVHPDRKKLAGQTVFMQPDIAESPSALAAVEAMLKGETGDMSYRMNDFTWYLFYKPFVRANVPGRSMETLDWSIATAYPKSDIFGEYNHLVFYILGIVLAGLFVFYILCRMSIRGQLKPLIALTETADSIAEGHYDKGIEDSKRDDEVGVFQQHFQLMQKALAADIHKQEEQQAILKERQKELEKTYRQTQEDDKVKNTFLHNVTNRMIAPSKSILDSVTTICDENQNMTLQDINRQADNIRQQSEAIRELLSHKFSATSKEKGKEEHHE